MVDGGYYAIKGFDFQIDKTILEILISNNNTPISFEQIQDISTDSFVMQIKYKETQNYTLTKIKDPIIQLINEYKKEPQKNYYLYCYFKDIKEKNKKFIYDELKQILKKTGFDRTTIQDFCSKFELRFSKKFNEQFKEVVSKIQEIGNCDSFDEALVFYGNITNHLRKSITDNQSNNKRFCDSATLTKIIGDNRKIVFDSAYRDYKGKEKYFTHIKKKHFTNLNIDNWERFIIIELYGNESISNIKAMLLTIKKKFYKTSNNKIKSGAPYIYLYNISSINLAKIKKKLITDNVLIRDGHDFKDADFCLNSLKIKSTIENNISIKFINNRDNLKQILKFNFDRTKIIYNFHYTKPYKKNLEDIKIVSIKINNISEIEKILN